VPKRKEEIIYKEQEALRYVMFIKEKRYETVKVRGCANRRVAIHRYRES